MTDKPEALITDPARKRDFEEVFGTANVPVTSFLPAKASVGGSKVEAFFLDLKRITPDQKSRLVAHLAKKFQSNPERVVKDLDTIGMPILAKYCTVAIPLKFFM